MPKTRELTITQSKGSFNLFRRRSGSKQDFDFSGISALRQALSNEKSRLLHIIKTQNPRSIYDLAKKSKRGFKAVMDDVKFLKRFGFIELIEEKTKKRIRHRPQIVLDTLTIHFKI